MHTVDLDMKMDEMTKVEGAASLDIKIRGGKATEVHFGITEYKRFFTEAMKGKPTVQTKLLRALTMDGLIIRDHALHLYLFAMPDIYGKDAFLDFDESDPDQHQQLHDAFDIKGAGNFLANLIAGRSVHATYPTIGGFLHYPDDEGIKEAIKKLQAVRLAVLRLVDVFLKAPFHFDRKTHFMALVPDDTFGYITGKIVTSLGESYGEDKYRDHLEHTVIPYSQASGYEYKGTEYMVGSLARINLAQDKLHPKTKESLKDVLKLFPSTDIFFNNLAQAIETLHSVDEAIDMLTNNKFVKEPLIKKPNRDAVGVGVIEAPRGTLYHKVHLMPDGNIKEGEVIVPTGQNQMNIERDIATLVDGILIADTPKEKIELEIEKLIRAYDPCMSCASHFLKVKWDKA